jgi:hypothetical protein
MSMIAYVVLPVLVLLALAGLLGYGAFRLAGGGR